MIEEKTIAVIGTGNMGEIMIRGLQSSRGSRPKSILAVEIHPDRREMIQNTFGVEVADSAEKVVGRADIVLVAVKPQNIGRVLEGMRDLITESHVLISIAAGVSTDTIADRFPGKKVRIIRVMPNAPALVLEGASALYAGVYASSADLELAREIFNQVGTTVVVEKEEFMDIVTGLSGSGPAYLFMIIEALSDAGVQQGLPRKVANRLAAQTVYGAGKMFLETDLHAGALKDLVATPGGTTFAGLRALENGNFRAVIMDAVEAATLKSKELGKKD